MVIETFDYSKTNKLLNRTHKQFMKYIASCPQKITKIDVAVLRMTFSIEEILHIILLVAGVKQRIQLNYFAEQIYNVSKSCE